LSYGIQNGSSKQQQSDQTPTINTPQSQVNNNFDEHQTCTRTSHLLTLTAKMQPLQTLESQVRSLRQQVESTETQLRNLRLQLEQAEQQCASARQLEQAWAGGYPQDWITETLAALSPEVQQGAIPAKSTHGRWPLESEEYKRYGRQMILPEVGLHGQLRLKNAKVLLVGVGGLGCPAAAYLAGAGVGTIGLMDGDTVEISNLHRQVAHGTERVGMSKVDSAVEYLTSYVSVSLSSLKSPSLLKQHRLV
jgi:hypothetical protein